MADEGLNVCAPIESILGSIPLCSTPLGRVAVFGGLGGATAYVIKPSMSFNDDGSAKPWILFDPSNPQAAIFPSWAFFLVPALIFGVLI